MTRRTSPPVRGFVPPGLTAGVAVLMAWQVANMGSAAQCLDGVHCTQWHAGRQPIQVLLVVGAATLSAMTLAGALGWRAHLAWRALGILGCLGALWLGYRAWQETVATCTRDAAGPVLAAGCPGSGVGDLWPMLGAAVALGIVSGLAVGTQLTLMREAPPWDEAPSRPPGH